MSPQYQMGSLLDFTEAIKDSPSFRHEISLNERHFDKAHKRLDEALRLVELVVDHGQNYVASFYNLTASLNGLWTDMDVDEPTAQDTHKLMSDALAQLVHLNKSLVESAYPALRIGLEFLRNDLSKLNETRSQFDSLSSSLSDALAKKASINKNKTQELQDARNSLTAVGTCFAHNSLDYVALMNIAHARKSHVVLESLWAFVKESASYFHKGDTFFNEKPYCQTDDITDAIDLLKNRVKAVERKMQDRHSVVPREVFQHPAGLPTTDPHVVMEGYLFKRATNAFKTWNRRWFMIKEDKLLYSHKSSDGSSMPTIMEENLKLCLVRPAPTSVERACCFELVTPSKNHLLQADSESLCNAWIRALQRTIQHLHEDDQGYRNTSRMSFISNFEAASARSTNQSSPPNGISVTHRGLASASTMPANVRCQSSSSQAHPDAGSNSDVKSNGSVSSHTTTKSRASSNAAETMQFVRQLCSTPGNERCADCGHTDAKWASINLGVIICIECSGAHRSLGVHRSKVRSLTMDSLEPEQRNILLQLGNKKVNSIFLACVPTDSEVVSPEQLTPHSSREAREAWIIAKYVDKKFSRPDAQRHLNSSLKTHARSTSMNDMATYGITHYNAYFSPSPQTSIDKETPSSSKESKFGAANDPKIEITNAMEPGSLGDNRISRTSFGSDSNLGPLDDRVILNAVESGCLESILRLLVRGFNANSRIGSTTALHVAVNHNRNTVIEYLLLNDAKINNVDDDLNTPLHVAARIGQTIVVYQLLKKNSNKSLKNRNGQTPLDIAMEACHADIVTLLRLHELESSNDDMSVTMTDVDNFIDDLAAKQKLEMEEKASISTE